METIRYPAYYRTRVACLAVAAVALAVSDDVRGRESGAEKSPAALWYFDAGG